MISHLLPIATHCFAFCLDYSYRSRTCSFDSSFLSACLMKNCFSSATSEEDVVTSIGVVWISSRTLRRSFSLTLSSSLEKQSAAMLTKPAICSILKLNCNTYSPAYQRAGGIGFVWKKCVTDILSVRKIVGFVACQRMCANYRKAM